MKRLSTVIALTTLLSGCGGNEVISEKNTDQPAALVEFETTLPVTLAWSAQLNRNDKRHGFNLNPVEVDGKIYIVEAGGRIAVHDAATGVLLWEKNLGATLSSGAGIGEGLLLVGTEDGVLLALDAAKGDIKWRTALSSVVLAAPQLAAGKVVVSLGDGKVIALDANNGLRIWVSANTVPALSLRGSGRPVIVGERVIVGFADGHLVAFHLNNGKRLWETAVAVAKGRSEIERLVDIDATPLIVDGTVYTATYQGQVAALALDSGQIIWAREASAYVDITVDDTSVYFSDARGELWALDRKSGATLWRQDKLRGRSTTAPALLGNYIAVGDFQGYLHWMTRVDGKFVARVRMELADRRAVVSGSVHLPEEDNGYVPAAIRLAPRVGIQKILVRDENGVLAAFKISS